MRNGDSTACSGTLRWCALLSRVKPSSKHSLGEAAGIAPEWNPDSIIEEQVERIREQVGDAPSKIVGCLEGLTPLSPPPSYRGLWGSFTVVFVDHGLSARRTPPG